MTGLVVVILLHAYQRNAFDLFVPRVKNPAIQFTDPVTYHITQTISVENHDVSSLGLLELNLPIPLNWPEQEVRGVKIKGDAVFRLPDIGGMGKIVRSIYKKRPPKPGQRRTLSISYELTRSAIRVDAKRISDMPFVDYEKDWAKFRPFLQPEKSIESDSPEIVALAKQLRAKARTPYRFARAAYDYVIDHTQYVSPSPGKTALECLHNGRADCGSYSLLFVAICRAGGVAARPVAGCWALGEDQWHCWAEFHVPGAGWIPADPTVGDNGPNKRDECFGYLDNNRVALAKTFNLTVQTKRGSTDVGFVQVGTWWWYPAAGSTGSKITVERHFAGVKSSRSTTQPQD